jgi:hypothetical protein
MLNIFTPTPRINPSDLLSIDGDETAFANPVIGTIVPAPACFASFEYKPRPVNKHERNISTQGVKIFTCCSSKPKKLPISLMH